MTTESILLAIGSVDLRTFLKEGVGIKELIERSLDADATARTQFTDLLLNNHANDDGSPQILNLQLRNAEFDMQTLKGKVTFDYRVGYTYACSGSFPENDRHETCSFTLDKDKGIIHISFLKLYE